MTHVITDLTPTPVTGAVDIATTTAMAKDFATTAGRKFISKLKKKEDHTYQVPQKFTNNSETVNCASALGTDFLEIFATKPVIKLNPEGA